MNFEEKQLKSSQDLAQEGGTPLEKKLDRDESTKELGLTEEQADALEYARTPKQRQEGLEAAQKQNQTEQEAAELGISVEELQAIDNYARTAEQRQEAIKIAQKNSMSEQQSDNEKALSEARKRIDES